MSQLVRSCPGSEFLYVILFSSSQKCIFPNWRLGCLRADNTGVEDTCSETVTFTRDSLLVSFNNQRFQCSRIDEILDFFF